MSEALATRNWIQQFVEKASGAVEKAPAATPLGYVKAAGSVAGGVATGGALAALLGAAHARFGLDIAGVPVDGTLGGLAALAAIGLQAKSPQAAVLAERSAITFSSIFLFRKTAGWMGKPVEGGGGSGAVTRIPAPGKGPGIAGEDPIVKEAEKLG